jgi:hypothetical protein
MRLCASPPQPLPLAAEREFSIVWLQTGCVSTRFLVNLRPMTMSPPFVAGCRPRGYLAPPTYLTSATRAFARTLGHSQTLLVDNGRFDDIARIANAYAEPVQQLLSRALPPSQRQGNTGRLLTGRDQEALKALVRALVHDCRQVRPGLTLGQQMELFPTGVVGAEDIAAVTALRAGLDLDLLPDGRRQLRRWNEGVVRRALREVKDYRGIGSVVTRDGQGLRTSGAARYYIVASALDYDTAFDAGQILANNEVGFAAIGFGAFMADDAYTNTYKRGGRWHTLSRPMPQRYIRTALVARGLFDGFAAAGSSGPTGFHFLGLGAPIMMCLVTIAGYGVPQLSFDATSPIRHATQGTLYFREPAPLAVRTRRMAVNLTDRDAYRWPCNCPFCSSYLAEHPFDLDSAKRWRRSNPDRPIVAADLRASAPLGQALPLLSEPSGGPARGQVDLARIGHNHWTLEQLVVGINRHGRTRSELTDWVGGLVRSYVATTNSPGFGRAIRASFDLITAASM